MSPVVDKGSPRAVAGRFTPWLLLPLSAYAYPAVAALISKSEIPLVLGRWSTGFFLFNLWSLAVVGLTLWAWRRGAHGVLSFAYLLLIVTTVLVPANNQMRALPGVEWLMPVIRLLAGFALVFVAFDRQRRVGRPQGLFMGLGALFVMLSLLDFALFGLLAATREQQPRESGLREEYALGSISRADVVLIGDSFVWGEGVAKEERFGDRLEALFVDDRRMLRVYSLGQTGTGLRQYIEMLESLPPQAVASRVVVAFYLNDMPGPETPWREIEELSVAFGRGFPSARLLGDKLAKLLASDVHAYHGYIVESFDEDHPTYDSRWALLEQELGELRQLADRHSAGPPLLMILPIMVDFADYPLDDGHRRLAAAAQRAGFEVLDLLPVFRRELGDGDIHRSGPDDNHFNAETHALVARTLRDNLALDEAP